MKGATDGGKHIEGMRTGRMRKGPCELQATGCERMSSKLEFHHESYRPERGLYCCHHCHHLSHFRPWSLTDGQKDKLLQKRHGPVAWGAFQKKQRVVEMMRRNYVAPGRRPAQMEVRKKVRERARERERKKPKKSEIPGTKRRGPSRECLISPLRGPFAG